MINSTYIEGTGKALDSLPYMWKGQSGAIWYQFTPNQSVCLVGEYPHRAGDISRLSLPETVGRRLSICDSVSLRNV